MQKYGAISPSQTDLARSLDVYVRCCIPQQNLYIYQAQLTQKIAKGLGWSRICLPSTLNDGLALKNHFVHKSKIGHVNCRSPSRICC